MTQLIKFGDPRFSILTVPTHKVNFPLSEEDKQCISSLRSEIEELKDQAAGLAANQIGIAKHIFLAKINRQIRVFINTEVLGYNGNQTNNEGCLSLPELVVKVKCPKSITIKSQDEEGNYHTEVFEKGNCQVIFHELKHMSGRLIVDDFNSASQKEVKRSKFGMKLTVQKIKQIISRRVKKKVAKRQK